MLYSWLYVLRFFGSVISQKKPTTKIIRYPKIVIISPTKKPTFTPTPTFVPTFTPIPPTITPTSKPLPNASSDLEELFTRYATAYDINKDKLKKIAYCESTYNPQARAGVYGGLYQFTESFWVGTRALMGTDTNPDLRFNSEEAIKTAAFLISQNRENVWPSCNK